MGRYSRNDKSPSLESSSATPQGGVQTSTADFELVKVVVAAGDRFKRIMEQASREPRIGFDLESNGFFRYPERICLIQLSTSKRNYLLDVG